MLTGCQLKLCNIKQKGIEVFVFLLVGLLARFLKLLTSYSILTAILRATLGALLICAFMGLQVDYK